MMTVSTSAPGPTGTMNTQGDRSRRFLFLFLGLLGAFFIFFGALLWFNHTARQKAERRESAAQAQSIAEAIRLRLRGNADYLLLLARERAEGTVEAHSFQERASQYVRFHPELMNVTWVDRHFVIKDVAPRAGNSEILGLRLDLPEPKRVSRFAMEEHAPVYTRPFEAIQGRTSFEIWVPVYRGSTFLGLFGGVYSCEEVLRQLVPSAQLKLFHPMLINSSGALLAALPAIAPLDQATTQAFPVTPKESGVTLQLTGYRQEQGDWRVLILEFICMVLALGIAYAVTQQTRANEAVRISEERLRELLENTHLAAAFLDPEGKVTYCNQYLLDISGRGREEAIGADWFELFVPEEAREKARRALLGPDRSEQRSQTEITLLTRQGKPRTLLWDITVLHHRGTTGIACLGIDVTGQRSLEEQLRQSQKMEAIGQLAGGVAHDFNNILTVIAGFANILQFGELDEKQKEQVAQIIAAAERGSQLTHGLLTFSRKQVMDTKVVNLNDLVQHVRQFLARVIGEDIQLKTIYNEATLNVRVDQGQMEMVLINLAANARDAMPKGGRLTVETSREEVDPVAAELRGVEAPGKYAVIAVSDTGTGMTEEVRTRLFEPFFTTKELGKGTGLGMAIVYGIVKQHKGQINVYSEPGQGTTFRVYIPLAFEEQSPETPPVPAAEPRRGNETILLAEDDAAVRDLVERVLTGFGYEVILAADGEEAVEVFRANAERIHLVVMDLIMPRKSGAEAYEEIRKLQPEVKVLFTSGYPRDFIQNREELEKGIELIMKPVQPMALLQKVREMLDRKGE